MAFNPMGEYWKWLYPMTPAEQSIEPFVAALGIPYRTQFPCWLFGMGKYFPDFLLPTIGVVLEVDDDGHLEDEQKAADALRTAALEKLGYVVVRCTNDEALYKPAETIKRLITPELLARKGPPLPEPKFKEKKAKKKKHGNRTHRSRSAIASTSHPRRAALHQEDQDQVGRPPGGSCRQR